MDEQERAARAMLTTLQAMAPKIEVSPPELTQLERLRLVEIAAGATDARVKEHALRLLDAAGALLPYARPASEVRATVDPPEGAEVRAMVRGHAPDLEPDGLAPRGG